VEWAGRVIYGAWVILLAFAKRQFPTQKWSVASASGELKVSDIRA